MFKRMIASWRGHRAQLARIEQLLERVLAASQAQHQALDYKLKPISLITMYLERLELMATLSHPRFASPLRLERFGQKTFSQFDEDGIIAEIFRRIGETSRTFVEIAAGDGKENCTALLLSQGWRGLWAECGKDNLRSIQEAWPSEIAAGQLKIAGKLITVENVNDVIAQSGVGDEVDLLVMDIDGNDYHVLEAIKLRPRVICTEYFARKPPPVRWIMRRSDDYNQGIEKATSASLQSFEDMLTPRGYSLVGTSVIGVNAFFVRSDLVEGKFEAPFTAYNHYNSTHYWYPVTSVVSTVWNGPADGKAPKP